MHKQSGFTLIELMVVVGILGILASVAIPIYSGNTTEVARKSDCIEPLLEIATQMEILKASDPNNMYPPNGSMSAAGIPFDNTKGYYTFEISASSANGYTLTCKDVDSRDAECGSLTYNNFGQKGTSFGSSAAKIKECWR